MKTYLHGAKGASTHCIHQKSRTQTLLAKITENPFCFSFFQHGEVRKECAGVFVAAASWVLCGSCAGQVKTIKKIDYVVD